MNQKRIEAQAAHNMPPDYSPFRCTMFGFPVLPMEGLALSNWIEQVGDGAVLLTVNKRLSRHQMARYHCYQVQAGHDWWETPDILPFRSWMSAMQRQALGMGLTERTLVPSLLVKRTWQRIIGSDKNVSLLDVPGAARSALQAWELSCVWQCKNPEDDYLSADQYAWQRWMKRYCAWLDERQGLDEPMLADVLVDVLQAATREQLDVLLPRTLILDGFIQLPAQFQHLMNVVRECGTQVQVRNVRAHAVVQPVCHADDDTELLSIAAQMRAELEHDPQQSLALVVPDLQQRRDAVVRAFERVFYPVMSPVQVREQVTAYEISLGQSLSDQPVISAALVLLRLCVRSVGGNELSALLLSPYWKNADAEMRRREHLDRNLRDRRVNALTLEQLIDELYKGSALVPACKALIRLRKTRNATLGEWASRFSLWLKTLGWPGPSIDSEEYQGMSTWLECLDDMQVLDEGELLSFDHAIMQLKALADDRVFQIETPAKPIQVMGSLESHGLDFDCLWVAGLDGEQWPAAGSPSPFLSVSEQKKCGVPGSSAAGRLALAEKEYRLWASQAPLMIVSSVQAREGKELSAALLPVHEPDADSVALAGPVLARLQGITVPDAPVTLIAQALNVVAIDDWVGPVLAPGSKVGGGARLFENQALCPFRAFALHRLKIRPLEEVGIGLDPRQHGTLLHNALELFWEALVTHEALLALSEEELLAGLDAAIRQAMIINKVPEKLQTLELTRLTNLLHEWIVKCELPRQPFTVKAFEQKQSIEHGGIVMDVVIDRIDDVDGASVVIDYKTGVGSRVGPWADDRIANPQLPLYVLTDEEIDAASFAQVSVNQCKFIGISRDEQMLPNVSTRIKASRGSNDQQEPPADWQAWRAHWQRSFDVIAAELRQGIATVTPMKSACTYCELKSLCRIDRELASSEDAEAAGDQASNVTYAGTSS